MGFKLLVKVVNASHSNIAYSENIDNSKPGFDDLDRIACLRRFPYLLLFYLLFVVV